MVIRTILGTKADNGGGYAPVGAEMGIPDPYLGELKAVLES